MLKRNTWVKLIIALSAFLLIACTCPESQSIKSFADTNLEEYKQYLLNDPHYKKPENDNQLKIRLMRIETFKAVADGLK